MSAPSNQRALEALERRLLEAARLERPDSSARQRALLALAGGAALGSVTATSAAATMSSAGSAAGTGTIAAASGSTVAAPSAAAGVTAFGGVKVLAGVTTLASVVKAVAIGAISGAVVLGAAQRIQRPEPGSAVQTASPAGESERPAPRPIERPRATSPAPSAPEPLADDREIDAPSIEPPLGRPVAAPASRIEKEAPAKANPPPVRSRVEPTETAPAAGNARAISSLADEVAQLDRARDALVTGDPSRALVILDSYERAKVGSTLSAEAALLRIEALVQRGESGPAATLAAEFLRAHPQSPVADRMRSIIQASPR